MFGLLIWTQSNKNIYFYLFIFTCAGVGIAAEIVGVNTGFLFGDYKYGGVLGLKILSVPLLIGINWFVIIFCCGIFVHTFLVKIINKIAVEKKEPPMLLKSLSVIIDGATLAVFFDWLMEPVAVKLGYWQWINGEIPFFNYVSWFIISIILLSVFQHSKFSKHNKFAVNLLLIQLMFFLLLRTFN